MALNTFQIIDTTLREGEQFLNANFTTDDKIAIAEALSEFGVEYIEVTSPYVSPKSRDDCLRLSRLNLSSKLIAHTRCHIEDVKVALDAGVEGLNMTIGISPFLRRYSHKKSIDEIVTIVIDLLNYINKVAPDIEIRFSGEDTFRTAQADIVKVYQKVIQTGHIKRIGLADTVGKAEPDQVFEMVRSIREMTDMDIEFHGHNDTGCAVANAYFAIKAGATHIDTSILGIGERNGITPLESFIARIYTVNSEIIQSKYKIKTLLALSKLVADILGEPIPFNQCLIGKTAFTHKAGIHTNATLMNPETYEIFKPEDFGMKRQILLNHKLVGWHAVQNRALELGIKLDADNARVITKNIKSLADEKTIELSDIDEMLINSKHNI